MKFYTNVLRHKNKIYMKGYDLGLRVSEEVNYEPYLFVPSSEGEYSTIDNNRVGKKEFNTMYEANSYVKKHEGVKNAKIYGLTDFPYVYIYDNYPGDIEFDPRTVRIGILDIEVESDDGFPSIENADKALTAITLMFRNKFFVFGCGEFTTTDPNVFYFQCKDEKELIQQFLKCWEALDLDILSGWYIEFFDIPYLINRILKLFSESQVARLSPWGLINKREVDYKHQKVVTYDIQGISVLDYYHMYRKFTQNKKESYTLNYICSEEIGEKKTDYSEYGTLQNLYKKNFQLFIEYNIRDTALVRKLNDRLQYFEQVMQIAYRAKVNFPDTLGTVKTWDVIIHNYLMEQNIVVPFFEKEENFTPLVGGYVKDPHIGLSEWVVSFDFDGMYPHLIMALNISPETFIGHYDRLSIDEILEGKLNDIGKDPNLSYSANGCCFRRDKQGFLPTLMESMYAERDIFKKKMLKEKEKLEDRNENLISKYNNMQKALKVLLNGLYGALSNDYFRWKKFIFAEAITTTGQLASRYVEHHINLFMNEILKTEKKDRVCAIDTDSCYLVMNDLIKTTNLSDPKKITDLLDKFCIQKVGPFIEETMKDLSEYMQFYQPKLRMKRESIIERAIWRGKKMYILSVWNEEGVQYKEPMLKMVGIETARSSTPQKCRDALKKSFEIVMRRTEADLQKFVKEFHDDFYKMKFEEVAFPRSVNDIKKYKTSDGYAKGTPVQVKAAIFYNKLLEKHELKNLSPIKDGDSIKFCYLKEPNPLHSSVLGILDVLPKEFGMEQYIDYDIQYEKTFAKPLESITSLIGWHLEETQTLNDFFE